VHATAIAHPNIALIKYWGKRDSVKNLPAVGSISITLDTLTTTTRVAFDPALNEDLFELDGAPAPDRLDRVRQGLDLFRPLRPDMPRALVQSANNFPTAAGLASSASGFAALVMAVDAALGTGLDRSELASMARQCSGSAARSLYGGFAEVELVEVDGRPETVTRQLLEADAWRLRVVIAITSASEKGVGSTEGMERTRQTSPYYRTWVETSETDLARAREAIAGCDFEALAEVSEHSCLKMHAVMLTARPGLMYWYGTTVECLHRIRELRRQGVAVFFTVDAGPQVKAVCLPEDVATVADAMGEIPGVVQVMTCGLGEGARTAGA
jgi:diphosphomevalonate decarboxylase